MTEQQDQTPEGTRFAAPNHKQRRAMMKQSGYLRAKGKLGDKARAELRETTREQGRQLHEAHLDAVEKQLATQLEEKLAAMTKTWASIGYNEEEIKLLEEAYSLGFINNKETRKQDKKTIKRLMKEAADSKQKRNA